MSNLNLESEKKYSKKFIDQIKDLYIGMELGLFALDRYNATHKKQVTELTDEESVEMLIEAVNRYIKVKSKFERGKIDGNVFKLALRDEGIEAMEYLIERYKHGKYFVKTPCKGKEEGV